MDNFTNVINEKFQVTASGAVEIRTRGDRVNSGTQSSKQVCISHDYTNLSTTSVAMDDGLGYGNAGIITISIENVDDDQCVFQLSTGRENAVAHRYRVIVGSNANCNINQTGPAQFQVSNMGDGRTYTVDYSTGAVGTPCTWRASGATSGETRIVIHALFLN